MPETISIRNVLKSDDPLSADAIKLLIKHKEEDLFVDYKESFDNKDEKHWIGITTDAMSFANTMGGFIIFGVKDEDFSVSGLPDHTIKVLTDTNQVLQKLNRYVSPHFNSIRTKEYKTDTGTVTIMYVPESKGKTHIFVKDVNYKYPSGTTKKLISAGMIFIRRSATNKVLMPEDFEFIINRRIEYYKESILSKISKVIESPPEHNVLIFDPNSIVKDNKKYTITDSDSAIPIKGMSFSIAPSTDIEECCGWISLSKRDPTFVPSHERLWNLYSIRKSLILNHQQLLEILRYSLLLEHPVFYWIKDLNAEDIKQKIIMVFDETKRSLVKANCLRISSFLGRTFYKKLYKKVGVDIKRIDPKARKFPSDPFELFHKGIIKSKEEPATKNNEELFRSRLEDEFSKIVKELSKGVGGVLEKTTAIAIDCYLYAKTDKYV
jgi:Schlafen, AlbA_2